MRQASQPALREFETIVRRTIVDQDDLVGRGCLR